ncbi:putative D-amino acid oxidase [Actinoplanes missouriensis 431]|uniref:D-amino-acid oxidase n=1 Tax=Actinoplanes missouriensis (strain ATCC 14538 / DSM 43046 / CBS 188.64 / JCM 3121 / NBRC 102363 / NCIMB 12654 / NRRL B-3342 / UNCC 431) TaxID=512565 RepID=I0H0Z4_ACTM4|nr:FAD-dependent oxidoreductase [Actinoplanes missouriensis]BAL86681.1 putative D-amino acid oxidase [Actinoplanes missouriensis 431]
MIRETDVVVLGAGVSGLTCAVRLAEAGLRVLVRSNLSSPRTTSCAAGAIWGPHLVAHDRAEDWALQSLEVFRELAADPAATGVRMLWGVEAGRGADRIPPPGPGAEGVRECDRAALPPGYTNGWRYRVPLIDMTRYLAYLTTRLLSSGGQITVDRPVTRAELPALGPIVVNCTGLGARELVPGETIRPVRGDLLVLDNPGIDTFFVEAEENQAQQLTTYVLPQGDRVMLGGSLYDGEWSTAEDPVIRQAILDRCTEAEPSLAGARLIEHRVGLRPVRDKVRIGPDERHPHVIHDYGHGGGGVTLSWGCAEEVLQFTGAAAHTTRRG